ncbi:hypothetical protein Cob_v006984 [Colletotrichum orbiculare MAFF 240422]|uniref:Uncharacterized protein n=1 Tax=Colletotrichum orbiculare (strain 104-T / ATCC 96160 / CBS 514.97 / LARS 414 / MAFF 240422) TaxID=1213857 RepID=A0A484FQA3_COLOR|nr:hypothetical protein Cob_v006984 [Colletotrichum orbiculare MAFF 240422]
MYSCRESTGRYLLRYASTDVLCTARHLATLSSEPSLVGAQWKETPGTSTRLPRWRSAISARAYLVSHIMMKTSSDRPR